MTATATQESDIPGPGPRLRAAARATRAQARARQKRRKGKGGKTINIGGLKCCSTASDDRMICYAYNDGRHCDGDCGMLHVCRVIGCADTHPMVELPGFDHSKHHMPKSVM